MTELHSLGLANYYSQFVEGFSRRVAPPTKLLKKDTIWRWSTKCQSAFEELKATMTRGPVLELVNVMKPFEVETDASDYAFRGILPQEGHPSLQKSKAQQCREKIYRL